MYVVKFKVKKTGKEGKYYHIGLDSARAEFNRLKQDSGLKSVKMQQVNM